MPLCQNSSFFYPSAPFNFIVTSSTPSDSTFKITQYLSNSSHNLYVMVWVVSCLMPPYIFISFRIVTLSTRDSIPEGNALRKALIVGKLVNLSHVIFSLPFNSSVLLPALCICGSRLPTYPFVFCSTVDSATNS